MRQQRAREAKLASDRVLAEAAEEIEVMLELAREDPAGEQELEALVARVEPRLERIELETKMTGDYDAANAYLEVHPGAGGTESADWAQMLLRMYLKWADAHGFVVEILDQSDGEGQETHAVANQIGLTKDGLVRRGQRNHETALP